MKKVELVLAGIALLLFTLQIFDIANVTRLYVLAMSVLAFLYVYLGFAILTGVGLKDITQKAAYKGIPRNQIVLAVFTGVVIGLSAVSILFSTMHWLEYQTFALVSIILLSMFSAVFMYRTRQGVANIVQQKGMPRTLLFLVFTTIAYFTAN